MNFRNSENLNRVIEHTYLIITWLINMVSKEEEIEESPEEDQSDTDTNGDTMDDNQISYNVITPHTFTERAKLWYTEKRARDQFKKEHNIQKKQWKRHQCETLFGSPYDPNDQKCVINEEGFQRQNAQIFGVRERKKFYKDRNPKIIHSLLYIDDKQYRRVLDVDDDTFHRFIDENTEKGNLSSPVIRSRMFGFIDENFFKKRVKEE